MKSLFKKFSTAVIVLAAVALLSVPLLGGARLAADCGRIEKKFNHFAAETDKHGNNFESDMVVFAANAESLCDEAARITGEDSPAVRSLQNDLAEYEKCGSAFEKFDCFKRLLADAKRVYASVPEGSVTDSLMTAMDGIESADFTHLWGKILRMHEIAFRSSFRRAVLRNCKNLRNRREITPTNEIFKA